MKVILYYRKSDGKLDAQEFEGVSILTAFTPFPGDTELENWVTIDGVTLKDVEFEVFPEPKEGFGLCANTSLNGVFSNLTQCHWNYSATGRVAFESDLHGTGQTCECEDAGIVVIFPWFEKSSKFWNDNRETQRQVMGITE